MTRSPCRIDGLLAAEANQVVLLRRGPSRHVQQLVWDLSSHRVTEGEWFDGRVNAGRSDVSADGRYVVLAIEAGNDMRRTLVARAMSFAALSTWHASQSGAIGGLWIGNRHLSLCQIGVREGGGALPPKALRVSEMPKPLTDEEFLVERAKKCGWLTLRDAERRAQLPSWEDVGGEALDTELLRQIGFGPIETRRLRESVLLWTRAKLGLVLGKAYNEGAVLHFLDGPKTYYRLLKPTGETRVGLVTDGWADVDKDGRLLWATGGRLYRSGPGGGMVSDLRANQFQKSDPPDWALSW